MRAKTTLAQRLPADMEEKIIEFQQLVLRVRRCHDYQLSHWMKLPCDLSSLPQEPSNSSATEQCQFCHAVETSRVLQLSWQLKPTEKNYLWKSFSKAFVSCESRYHQECRSRYTRKAGWMKKVFLFSCLFIFQSKSYLARGFLGIVASLVSCFQSMCALIDTSDMHQIDLIAVHFKNVFLPYV